MKKLIVSLLTLSAFPMLVFAADPLFSPVKTTSKTGFLNTSSGATLTQTMSPSSGSRRIVLDSVLGNSDLSSSVFTIQSSPDGSSYSTIAFYTCGATSTSIGLGSEKPVFIGNAGIYYKVILNSTTIGSMIVNYHEE